MRLCLWVWVLGVVSGASICEVCEFVLSQATHSSHVDELDPDHICKLATSPHCHSFWSQKGLAILSLLELGVEEDDICSHEHVKCHESESAQPFPPLPSFIQVDEAMKARDQTQARVENAIMAKVELATQGNFEDVSSYEAAKASKIESTMKDVLERYRRNENRLQSFRESLFSLIEIDSWSSTAFVEETVALQTKDVDDTLDSILAIIQQCKTLGTSHANRLKDVRGSLTSLIEVDSTTAALLARSGAADPSPAVHDVEEASDSEEVGKYAAQAEAEDRGTIPMSEGKSLDSDMFGNSSPHPLTTEEASVERQSRNEVNKSRKRRHRHHHRSSGPSTEELNAKLDQFMSAMKTMFVNNQDTSMKLKKIDRAGELVEKIATKSKDYSDAIVMMRGQFMSLLEESVTTTVIAADQRNASGPHHHRSDGEHPLGEQNLLQSGEDHTSEDGKLMRRLHPGGNPQPLVGVPPPDISSHTNAPSPPKRQAVPRQVSKPASDLEISPSSPSYADGLLLQEHEKRLDSVIEGLEDLMKQLEQNMDRIAELKRELDIMLQIDVETSRLSPAQRTAATAMLELFDDVVGLASNQAPSSLPSAASPPIVDSPAPTGAVAALPEAKSLLPEPAANPNPPSAANQDLTPKPLAAELEDYSAQDRAMDEKAKLSIKGTQELLVDAGIALDFAGEIETIVMGVEEIRGHKETRPQGEENDTHKNSLIDAVGQTLRKGERPDTSSATSRASDVMKSLAPGVGNSDAVENCISTLQRFTRKMKRNGSFIQNWAPKK